MILITGTTGLVGTHLLAKLLEKTEPSQIRGIFRSSEKKDFSIAIINRVYGKKIADLALDIEWQKADILEIPELEKAFKKIEFVYHCAGLISNSPSMQSILRKVNIEGTANVVNLAIEYNVNKFCHVSSIATLGKSKDNGIVNENSYRENLNNSSYYSIAKYGGEMEAWRGSQEGLDVLVINPGVILGQGFYEDGSGELFKQAANGFPFKINKQTGFIGVQDVVDAMLVGMESKVKNQRFILVSENLKMSEVQIEIAKNLGVQQPKITLKKWMLYLYWFFDVVIGLLTRKKRKLSFDVIPTLLEDRAYSNEKIKTELSLAFTPIKKVIKECCKDYKK